MNAADTEKLQTTASSTISPQVLASLRRRKRLDWLFSISGLILVMFALSVLLLLFGQLVREGGTRLFKGHFVKSNGFPPKFNELDGVLQSESDGSKTVWKLQPPDLSIDNLTDIASPEQLSMLEGRRVLIEGDLPVSGIYNFQATSVTESRPETLPSSYSRSTIVGDLVNTGKSDSSPGWKLHPIPFEVLPPTDTALDESWNGHHVAVSYGLAKSLPLKTKSIEKCYFQNFFNSKPSPKASEAGILTAIAGSILVVTVTMFLAIPLGVAAGVWLEEYAKKNWMTALIEINIANLAGVPSIVWGLMALGIFVYYLELGRSILTAGMTLGLLVLPIVIMATREAIRTIPSHIREASYACGATKWQTVRHHVIPYSMGGILTGIIIGLSRAIGETAPLITIGAFTFVTQLPDFSWTHPFAWLHSGFTVMPIQIFGWVSRPQEDFRENAAAASIVLLCMTLAMNGAAIYFRHRLQKRIKW